MDDQQRARELFEEWILSVYQVDLGRRGDVYLDTTVGVAWDAWSAALRAAPEGFVMVKTSALDGIRTAAEACWAQSQDKSFAEWVRDDAKGQARGLRAALAILAARPQGVKDA